MSLFHDEKASQLTWEGDWMHRKYESYGMVKTERYQTFKAALNLLLQNNGKVIVETGCMRMVNDGSGCSTLLFADFCKHNNCKLYTVDKDQKNMDLAREQTAAFKDFVDYNVADSLKFLATFSEPVDLLYLDSMDCDPDPKKSSEDAQKHQLMEFLTIESRLRQGSILLMDDSAFENGGKTRKLKNFILEYRKGWLLINDYFQTLFYRRY